MNQKTDKKELQTSESSLPAAQNSSPAEMMIRAKEAGLGADEMKNMLEVQKEWEANEARKAYHLAVKAFKGEEVTITKDKQVAFGDTAFSHASLANIVATTVPFLSEHGLSHSWKMEQTENTIKVTCTLTHELGHSESTSLQSAPDSSGKKNPIQAIASAVTYLERYTFLAITGLATADMQEDDGQAAGQGEIEYITEAQVMDLETLMSEVGVTTEEFLKVAHADSLDLIPATRFKAAISMLEKRRTAS